MHKISDIVKISRGYKSVVTIKSDIDNEEKVSSYIPTEKGVSLLKSIAKSLSDQSSERAYLISGTYGTGKSHLGVVLANYLSKKIDNPLFKSILEKIKDKYDESYEIIFNAKKKIETKPFIIVKLYQDEGNINDALLKALDEELRKLNLTNLLPKTNFNAALERINEIKKFPEPLKRFKKFIENEGLISVENFETQLKNYSKEALEVFKRLHPEFSYEASFNPHHLQKASDVYNAVAEKLRENKNYAGIIILWDEFGRYLESILENPNSGESLELQDFAETCNDSYLKNNKLFFFVIAHREFQEYLSLVNIRKIRHLSPEEQKAFTQDLRKVQGRFREFKMKSSDSEIFKLIDNVIIQDFKSKSGEIFIKDYKELLEIWTDKTNDYKVFPDFISKDEIKNVVVYGSYPLHPITACCLPKFSEKVAQNERTLFTFLCSEQPNTLISSGFLDLSFKNKSGKINIIPPDFLMNYFIDDTKKSDNDTVRKSVRDYLNAERVLGSTVKDIYKKIIKTIAVLNICSDERTKFLSTSDFLSFCLNEDEERIKECLEELTTNNFGERILVKNPDGNYRFYGAGVIDIDSMINGKINERLNVVDPVKILNEDENLWGNLEFLKMIEPKSYNDDYRMNRKLDIKVISLKMLEYKLGDLNDGVLLIALLENENDITRAKELIKQSQWNDPRILMGLPKNPVNFSYLVRWYDALNYLKIEKKELFSEGAELFSEWSILYSECTDQIKKELSPLFNPEKMKLDYYYKGEQIKGIINLVKLENFASDMMKESFPYTPIITRNELKRFKGERDTFKKYRLPVIDNIFKQNGPEILSDIKKIEESVGKQNAKPVITIIDDLKLNKVLVKKDNKWVIAKPQDNEAIAMIKLWEEVTNFVEDAKLPGKPFKLLIDKLSSPPYGLRIYSMPVIISLHLRDCVLKNNITVKDKISRYNEVTHNKIDGELIEKMVSSPENYSIIFTETGKLFEVVINILVEIFDMEQPYRYDLNYVREQINNWWMKLSQYARNTDDLSHLAKKMRSEFFIPLTKFDGDIKTLICSDLLRILEVESSMLVENFNVKSNSSDIIYEKLFEVKEEFENVISMLKEKVYNTFCEIFNTNRDSLHNEWKNWLKSIGDKKNQKLPGDAGKFLDAIRNVCENKGSTIEKDIVELSTYLIGAKPEDWTSTKSIDELRGVIRSVKKIIEEKELSQVKPPEIDEDHIYVSIMIDGQEIKRYFKKSDKTSQLGNSMSNLIKEALNIGITLDEEEKLTIVVNLLKEILK